MSESVVDLHLHTTASDGALSPTRLVDLVADRGLSIVAVTDHDSTEGLSEALAAAQRYPALQVIPGIELSAETESADIHILGYFLDVQNRSFQELLARLRSTRTARARQMVAKLSGLGMFVAWSRVEELAGGGAIGRLHIAQALYERGYVVSLSEAFDRFIGHDQPAYVRRYKLSPAEAIEAIAEVGGVAVMAHPMTVEPLEPTIRELAEYGLGGVECYYPTHSAEVRSRLLFLADELGLIPTGGSDFHGREMGVESGPGSVHVPVSCVQRLAARTGRAS